MRRRFRIVGVGVLVIVSFVVAVGVLLAIPSLNSPEQFQGVTFAAPHARGIGLNWQEAYLAVLDDLKVRHLRIPAYWNEIEKEDDQFDFSDLDFQMDEANARGAGVVLAIGRKVPRWPECHIPGWASGLPEESQQEEVLEMLDVVVKRYREHPALKGWQLENEPFLEFGVCPPEDHEFLAAEESLLRSLDSTHAIMVTDSGELNSWIPASAYGDLLGTTMYRTVFSERTQDHFYYDYIFPSWGYRLKARYVKLLRGKDVLISELQGEPWGAKPFPDMTEEERLASFSPERFSDLHDFAGRTQLPGAYWWGVEYWYWEKVVHDNPEYWEMAKSLF